MSSMAMAIQVFLAYHVFGLLLTRNACAHGRSRFKVQAWEMNGYH